MAGDWTEHPLLSLCVYLNRGAPPAYTDTGGILVLNQRCVRDQRVNFSMARRTDVDRKPVSTDRLVQPFDILINSTGVGTLGRVAQVRKLPEEATVDSHVTLARPDAKVIDPLYLGCAIRCFEPKIEALGEGSTGQTELSRKTLGTLLIPMPTSLEEQRAIAHILGTLDDKIELNRKQNETLEAMARALFKAWFIDFEPVRAKMDGRWQRGQSLPGLPAHLYDLFPDRLVDSELGEIPEGWTVTSIEEICSTITNGGTPSRSHSEFWQSGNIPWYKTGDFSDGFLLEPSEKVTDVGLLSSSLKLLPENAVLMAIYAAPTVGRLGILTRPSTFNQACTGMVAKNEVGTWFLYWVLYFGRDLFNSRANGAAQQNISKAIVAAYTLAKPTEKLLSTFDESASPIHKSIRKNVEQIVTLSALRDTLLPRLVSGMHQLAGAVAEVG